MHNT